MMRLCSAAVPSEGILNSTSTSVSSPSAASQPFRAMVQKSEALLVTNATLNFFAPPPLSPHETTERLTVMHRHSITIVRIFIFPPDESQFLVLPFSIAPYPRGWLTRQAQSVRMISVSSVNDGLQPRRAFALVGSATR